MRALQNTVPCLLAVCLACGSEDHTVEGGTAAQRAVVEAVLDELDASSSFVPRLSRIRIRPYARADGRYSTVDRSIVLADDVPDATLRVNARHELCHAVDFQLPYRSIDETSWGETRRERRESFAGLCQLGPDVLNAYADCGQGVWEAHAVGIMETIHDRVAPLPVLEERVVGSIARAPEETLISLRVTDRSTLFVWTSGTDQPTRYVTVDGEEVTPGGTLVDPPSVSVPEGYWWFSDAPLLAGDVAYGVGTESSRRLDLPGWEPVEYLFAVEPSEEGDARQRILANGCGAGIEQLFVLDDEAYVVRQTEEAFEWSVLSMPD